MKSMTFATAVGLLALVFGAASACSTQAPATAGSETNWLSACSSDSDCHVGQCVCGVCSTECSESTSCGGEFDTCASRGTAAFGALCGSQTVMTGACLTGCGNGRSCAAGSTCIGTACVPSHVGTGGFGASSFSNFTDEINAGPDGDGGTQQPSGVCLPQALPVDASGQVTCQIVEVSTSSETCDAEGLNPVSDLSIAPLMVLLRARSLCDAPSTPACSAFSFCGVPELSGPTLDACLSTGDLASPGWCYVDPVAGIGVPSLTASCPSTEQQLLRLKLPTGRANAHTLITCQSQTSEPASPPKSNPGAIGDPCVPLDESKPDFSSFDETEVNVETNAPDCGGNVCLAANFRGRVSCPYGQPSDPATGGVQSGLTPDQECFLPGTTAIAANAVTVPVNPQLVTRRAADVVTCSCRCDGPDMNATYCTCPSGFVCQNLVPSALSTASNAIAGSYCIKDGTQVTNPTRIAATVCDQGPPSNCGDPHPDGK